MMIKDILKVFSTNLIKMFAMLLATFFIPLALSIEEYASYKFYALIASYVGLFHFGFCDGVFVEYGGVDIKQIPASKLADEHKTIFLFEVAITAVAILTSLLLNNKTLLIVSLSIISTVMFSYYTLLYQSTGDFKNYANSFNIQSVMMIVTTAFLVFVVKYDSGLLYAITTVIVSILATFYVAVKFLSEFHVCGGTFRYSILKKYIQIGILLTIGNIAFVLFGSIDKWFVKILLGDAEFAYYSFAVQLLSLMNFVMGPVGFTLYSYICKRRELRYEYQLKAIITVLILFILGVQFAVKWVISNFMQDYAQAIPVVTILFLAQVFVLLNTILYVNLYKSYKLQYKYFTNLIISIVLSVVLNYLFYTILGHQIASFAYATLVSMVCWALLNLNDFKYLRYKLQHAFFVAFMLVVYWLTNNIGNDIIGGIMYYCLWMVLAVLLCRESMNTLYMQFKAIKKK